jgi:hypothetical protein
MYELMKPERSVHYRLDEGERNLALGTNERLLDVALHGVESVRQDLAASAPAPARNNSELAVETAVADDIEINILDTASSQSEPDFDISFLGDVPAESADLEVSYADKLDGIAVKVNRIFGDIMNDLFSDDDLLPRLRRLFWLEATKTERDFNNHLVKPMLKQHDRNLHSDELRQAMQGDLESVSDLEGLMRVWEGLHKLETGMAV